MHLGLLGALGERAMFGISCVVAGNCVSIQICGAYMRLERRDRPPLFEQDLEEGLEEAFGSPICVGPNFPKKINCFRPQSKRLKDSEAAVPRHERC